MIQMKLTGSRCQCSLPPYKGCGEYFNSTRAFDKHRTGSYAALQRRCLSAAEMTARGMAQNAKGFWVTSLRSDSTMAWTRNSGDRLAPLPLGHRGGSLAAESAAEVLP
jgi:hypothetical protein